MKGKFGNANDRRFRPGMEAVSIFLFLRPSSLRPINAFQEKRTCPQRCGRASQRSQIGIVHPACHGKMCKAFVMNQLQNKRFPASQSQSNRVKPIGSGFDKSHPAGKATSLGWIRSQKNQGGSRLLKVNQGGSRHFETIFFMKRAKNSENWPGWLSQTAAAAAKAGQINRFRVRAAVPPPGSLTLPILCKCLLMSYLRENRGPATQSLSESVKACQSDRLWSLCTSLRRFSRRLFPIGYGRIRPQTIGFNRTKSDQVGVNRTILKHFLFDWFGTIPAKMELRLGFWG